MHSTNVQAHSSPSTQRLPNVYVKPCPAHASRERVQLMHFTREGDGMEIRRLVIVKSSGDDVIPQRPRRRTVSGRLQKARNGSEGSVRSGDPPFQIFTPPDEVRQIIGLLQTNKGL